METGVHDWCAGPRCGTGTAYALRASGEICAVINYRLMPNALVIPCHIRTRWDLKCLLRLLDSVRDQSMPFAHVYVVDDASPLKYSLAGRDVEHLVLETNSGPAREYFSGLASSTTYT